jgi:hypothetical protein
MDQWCYRSTMRKCINSHSEINFSLAELITIPEISKKPSRLTDVLTANTMGTRPLFAIKPHDAYIARAIIQPFNINVTHAAQARIANTLHALVALKAMQRTTKNTTNDRSYCKNSIKIVLGPTGRTYQTP